SFFRLPFDSISFTTLKNPDLEPADDKEKTEAEKKEPKPKSEEIAIVVERPRHRPRGSIFLRGAKLVTMRGDEVIPDGDVLVTDHRIVAVGKTGSVKPPEGAKVLDLEG